MASYHVVCVLAALSTALVFSANAVNHSAAYVSGGSIVSITYIVNQQQREDVLNSTLYAQLAATGMYERYTDVDNWYKLYLETLRSVGWTIPNFKFVDFSVPNGTNWTTPALNMIDDAVKDQNIKDVVSKSLKAFQALEFNNTRTMIFNHFSMEKSESNFQLLAVSVNAQKLIEMVLGCFTTTTVGGHRDGFASVTVGTLSESVYGNYREGVTDKLEDAIITDILQINLPL